MRYTLLILATLSYAQTNSMEGIKEKWSNFCERINFSSISNRVSKDACLEKLNTFGTFLNSGLNRLVELTVRNDNYTTKEKAVIGAGTVGAVASIFGAKYVLKKSRLTKIPAPQHVVSNEDLQLEVDILETAHKRLLFLENLEQDDSYEKEIIDTVFKNKLPKFVNNRQKGKNELLVESADSLFETLVCNVEEHMKNEKLSFANAKKVVLDQVKKEMNLKEARLLPAQEA